MRLLPVVAVSIAATVSLSAQQWPSFRGANAAGVADGKPTPVTWNAPANENVLWKTPIPGVAVSSPIVWGDRVFVSTAVSSDPNVGIRTGLYGDVEPVADQSPHTWRLIALDKQSGKVLWDRVAHEGVPKTKRHPKSSQASPTPVTDGQHVIVSFGSEGLYAYDLDGKLLWTQDLGVLNAGWFFDPDYEWGIGSSPIIWKNLVIVQCDIQKGSFIAAFDVATGKQAWRTAREEIPSWSTPTVVESNGHAELVTQATTFTRGYDPATGKELWRLSGNSEIAIPTPIAGPGFVIVTNGYRGVQPIFAIKPGATGDITLKTDQTKSDFIAWSTTKRRAVHPDAAHLRRSALHPPEQRRARGLQGRDRRTDLSGAARRNGRIVQRVARRGRRQAVSHERGRRHLRRQGRTDLRAAREELDGRGGDGHAGRLRRHHLRARPEEPVCGRRAQAVGDGVFTNTKHQAHQEHQVH